MAKTKDHLENIFCLESSWGRNSENQLTVFPILDLIERRHYVKCAHLACNTIEQLKCHLSKFKVEKERGILYLAFHGEPGKISLDGKLINLESLAQFMGLSFARWVVLFGSCSTIDVPKEEILNFMTVTGVSMILGYQNKVDWMESAALDLLVFHQIQPYKDMRKFWSDFRERHKELISITGFRAFHR